MARQGHRLLQVGTVLFLVALIVGLAVPKFAVPRLALSTHLLGLLQGMFLMVLGLIWPRLRLAGGTARAASALVVYGCLAAWTANLLGAIWGAGNSMVPIAAGTAHGTGAQETAIAALLMTAAVALVASVAMVAWGLRGAPAPQARSQEVSG